MRIKVLGIRGLPSTYSRLETIMGELAPRWVQSGHAVEAHNPLISACSQFFFTHFDIL